MNTDTEILTKMLVKQNTETRKKMAYRGQWATSQKFKVKSTLKKKTVHII